MVMAITLTVAVFAVSDAMAGRSSPLAVRSTAALGLFAAAFFLMLGTVRFSMGPILYIDSLNRTWGESAYLIFQMIGLQGFAQAGIFALSAWAVAISLIGLRTRFIPVWLLVIGVIPALRLVSIPGVADFLPDVLWFVFVLAIPGVMVWSLLLGVVLFRRARHY